MLDKLALCVCGAAAAALVPPALLAQPAAPAPPPLEISRPARAWEYMDAVSARAAVFGNESGTVEAWVFPLKILADMSLEFHIGGRTIPGSAAARRILSRPGAYSIIYTGDAFQATQTFVAPAGQAGVLMRVEMDAAVPLELRVAFRHDFQLMWPGALGAAYVAWDSARHSYVFGSDGAPFAAVLTSPDIAPVAEEFATNYARNTRTEFSLGTVRGRAMRAIAIAGSMESRERAASTAAALLERAATAAADNQAFYAQYLESGVHLTLPDKPLERAYDWARASMRQGLVDHPGLGRGLVAGYGPSRDGYRPGFAWFFGRDSLWTSLALTASGDYATARAAIEFVARYQRDDGKMPHEISQAADRVDWFKSFPYAYASADATPLLAIAVSDYTESSGDRTLETALWPAVRKALEFQRATADEAGFPKNLDVGHGWVEGGPLLPVRTEFYQAGLHVASLRATATIARRNGDAELAAKLESEAGAKQQKLHELFWVEGAGTYAFAIGVDGRPVPRPSVLATVPMWFGVTDGAASRRMIRQLAAEEHSSDWGMRILSRRADVYDPSGYHFGSVWPLFTGWAAVGEYRYHQPHAALANLRANAWLTLDGPGGHTPEVLSGQTCTPLATGSPHQIWSAAMVVSPLVRGLLGLEVDRVAKRIEFRPHVPADWDQATVEGAAFKLALRRNDRQLTLEYDTSGAELRFAPALAPVTQVVSAEVDGKPISWTREEGGTDWHPVFILGARQDRGTLMLHFRDSFGIAVASAPPRLAEPSRNLKVLGEEWSGRTVELTVAGIPGRTYRLSIHGDARVSSVAGAALLADGRGIRVTIGGTPATTDGADYAEEKIRIVLAEDTTRGPAPKRR